MKKFYINQRIFTFGDKYDIYDEQKNVAYYVSERLFTFGKQFEVYHKTGRRVCYIKQKLFKFLPKYDLYMNDSIVATIHKKLSFVFSRYIIESRYGDFEIEGDFFAWNFKITKGGKTICSVSKNFNFFKDKYEIIIADGIDEVFALGLVIILDAIHHDGSNNNK